MALTLRLWWKDRRAMTNTMVGVLAERGNAPIEEVAESHASMRVTATPR